MIALRDYQTTALEAIHKSAKDHRNVLAVMATGTGKTILFAHLVAQRIDQGRAMILSHREEIIMQTMRKLREAVNLQADLELAGSRADDLWLKAPAVVGSIQTAISGRNGKRRVHRFDPFEFNTLIIDEAHHAVAASYRAVMSHYAQNPELRTFGFTATPDRRDEKALGMIFDETPVDYDLNHAVSDGWLVEPEVQIIEIEGVDFEACLKSARSKDFSPELLSQEMTFEKPLHAIAEPVLDIVGTKKAVIFAVSIHHAERLAEIFNRAMPGKAACVSHKTDPGQRLGIISDFRSGRIRYLCNVGIATEGFDVPDIEAVVQARPTLSRALHVQQLGRGTRPFAPVDQCETAEQRRAIIAASSKPHLIVLDFVGGAGRHKIVTTIDALAGRYDDCIIELAERKAREGPIKPAEALEHAVDEWKKQREDQRRSIRANVTYRTRKIDPFDILDMAPQRTPGYFGDQPASEKQTALLERFGVPEPSRLNKKEASRLIGELLARRNRGLCTFKQARYLKQFGRDPTEIKFKEASKILDGCFGRKKVQR